jgi:hypothetical protein
VQDAAWDRIHRCLVRVRDAGTGEVGTGFLVGPGLVLTARHAVKSGRATVAWQEHEPVPAEPVALALPVDADVALLRAPLPEHPIVKLGSRPRIRERVRFVGYAQREGVQHEETVTAEVEDDRFEHPRERHGVRLLKFKGGQTVGGASGSPLVREATMEVVGVVSDTRDPRGDLGGLAVPTDVLVEHVAELRAAQWESPWDDTPWRPPAFERDGVLRAHLDRHLAPTEPFFGRGADLDALDAWLDDAAGPRCALLTAPAGTGKSSLLAHWFDRLCMRPEVRSGRLDVAFAPITLAHGFFRERDVMPHLAARLAKGGPELFGEADRSTPRAFVSHALGTAAGGGQRRLLIIDGLDEAGDWEIGDSLLPAMPAAGIKVLAAGRVVARRDHAGWRAHLGWAAPAVARDFTLASLARAQVVEAARQWWSLGEWDPRAARLWDLTLGDPLILGLYLGDRPGEAPASLADALPGIEGFFHRWWQEQERQWGKKRGEALGRVGKVVLNVLAGAFEPLSRADLLAIVRRLVPCEGDDVDDALDALRRFVVGSGQTLALSHPRLGDSRWAALTKDGDHAAVEAACLESCEATLGESRYAVRCFARHLERAGAPPERWTRVAGAQWRAAWEEQDDWREGYLRDLRLAATRFASADAARFFVHECEIAWRRGLVDLQGRRIGPVLARELVRHGLWSPERAVDHVRTTQEGEQLIEALAELAPFLDTSLIRRAMAMIAGLPESAFGHRGALRVDALVRRAVDLGERPRAWQWLTLLTEASMLGANLAYAERSEGSERRQALARALAGMPDVMGTLSSAKPELVRWLSDAFTREELWNALGLAGAPDAERIAAALGLGDNDPLHLRLVWRWVDGGAQQRRLDDLIQRLQDPRVLRDRLTLGDFLPLTDVCEHAQTEQLWALAKPALATEAHFVEDAFLVAFALRDRLAPEERDLLDGLVPAAAAAACRAGHVPTAEALVEAMGRNGMADRIADTLVAHAADRWTAPYLMKAAAPWLSPARLEIELRRLDAWKPEDRDDICGALLGARATRDADAARAALATARVLLGHERLYLDVMLDTSSVNREEALDRLEREPDDALREQMIALLAAHLAPWTVGEVARVTASLERPGWTMTVLLPHVAIDQCDSGAVHGLWRDDAPPHFDEGSIVEVMRRLGRASGVATARDWATLGERASGHYTWRSTAAEALAPVADENELKGLLALVMALPHEHLRAAGLAGLLSHLSPDEQGDVWAEILEYLAGAGPPHRDKVADVLVRLPGERRQEALEVANVDGMLQERGSLWVWAGEYAALMPWASRAAIDRLVVETDRFARVRSSNDRSRLRAAVAPRLLALGDDQRAFELASGLGVSHGVRACVAMVPFTDSVSRARALARTCVEAGRLPSIIAVARALARPESFASAEVKRAFASGVLAAVDSQHDAVIILAALCPLIAELSPDAGLGSLAAIVSSLQD